MAIQGFPQCRGGDIEIHLTGGPKDKLVVHSALLSLNSPWFEAILSERWNGGDPASTSLFRGNDAVGTGGKHYWILELRFEKDSSVGILTWKTNINSTTDTEMILTQPLAHPATPRDVLLHEDRIACVVAHRNLLGILYSAELELGDGDLDKAIASIKALTEVAEVYACGHRPKPHVQTHLSKLRNKVLDRCTTDPLIMLELAMKVKVDWVFMDAAAVAIGGNAVIYQGMQAKLIELGIAGLFAKKRAEFIDRLRNVEYQLLCLRNVDSGQANGLAESIFREWLTRHLSSGHGSGLGGQYACVYYDTKTNMSCCISSEYVSSCFRKMRVKPDLPLAELTQSLNQLYIAARKIVSSILTTARSVHDSRVRHIPNRHLSFISVSEEELPWAGK